MGIVMAVLGGMGIAGIFIWRGYDPTTPAYWGVALPLSFAWGWFAFSIFY